MRRDARRNDADFPERQAVGQLLGQPQMAVVDRIEGTAEDAYRGRGEVGGGR
jgi:hypothetical protein